MGMKSQKGFGGKVEGDIYGAWKGAFTDGSGSVKNGVHGKIIGKRISTTESMWGKQEKGCK